MKSMPEISESTNVITHARGTGQYLKYLHATQKEQASAITNLKRKTKFTQYTVGILLILLNLGYRNTIITNACTISI